MQKITPKHLFWYNDKTIGKVKSLLGIGMWIIIDFDSKLYQTPQFIKETHLYKWQQMGTRHDAR